jgi:excisionase family DNA binding protein
MLHPSNCQPSKNKADVGQPLVCPNKTEVCSRSLICDKKKRINNNVTKNNSNNEPHHSLADLAAALHVSRMTVWRWAKEGRISTIRIGKLYRISDEGFQRILQQGTN